MSNDKKTDGGPAFPPATMGDGMTLRDYFAGQALANYYVGSDDAVWSEIPASKIAEECYRQADAMLKERNKGR